MINTKQTGLPLDQGATPELHTGLCDPSLQMQGKGRLRNLKLLLSTFLTQQWYKYYYRTLVLRVWYCNDKGDHMLGLLEEYGRV